MDRAVRYTWAHRVLESVIEFFSRPNARRGNFINIEAKEGQRLVVAVFLLPNLACIFLHLFSRAAIFTPYTRCAFDNIVHERVYVCATCGKQDRRDQRHSYSLRIIHGDSGWGVFLTL